MCPHGRGQLPPLVEKEQPSRGAGVGTKRGAIASQRGRNIQAGRPSAVAGGGKEEGV